MLSDKDSLEYMLSENKISDMVREDREEAYLRKSHRHYLHLHV